MREISKEEERNFVSPFFSPVQFTSLFLFLHDFFSLCANQRHSEHHAKEQTKKCLYIELGVQEGCRVEEIKRKGGGEKANENQYKRTYDLLIALSASDFFSLVARLASLSRSQPPQ
jgi:hypothetical protein